MDELISVIVPIYNSERYIYNCIQSLLKQTYNNFEVLLVDDGSTDSSRDVCGRICRTDNRFHLLSQSHRGVSFARNEGMKAAKGEYLFFLDSDDEIHPCLLETLHWLIQREHSTMAAVGYFPSRELSAEREPAKMGQQIHYTCLKKEEALECFPFEMQAYLFFAIGGKMILREAVRSLLFNVDLSNSEDTLFVYQVLAEGADVVVLHERWYYYRKHGDSANEMCSVRAYQNRYDVCRYICEQERMSGRITNAVNWEDFIARFMLSWRLISSRTHNHDLCKYISRQMHEEKEEELFSNVRLCTRARFHFARCCFPLYRRLFAVAVYFADRRNKEEALLPEKYRKKQMEESLYPYLEEGKRPR